MDGPVRTLKILGWSTQNGPSGCVAQSVWSSNGRFCALLWWPSIVALCPAAQGPFQVAVWKCGKRPCVEVNWTIGFRVIPWICLLKLRVGWFPSGWSWSLVEKPPFHSASTSADCLEVPMRPTAGLGWRINLQEPQQTWLNNAKNHGFLGVECSWNPSIDWFYIHVHLFWWPDPYLYFLMFYFLLDPHSVATHDQFLGTTQALRRTRTWICQGSFTRRWWF